MTDESSLVVLLPGLRRRAQCTTRIDAPIAIPRQRESGGLKSLIRDDLTAREARDQSFASKLSLPDSVLAGRAEATVPPRSLVGTRRPTPPAELRGWGSNPRPTD